MTRPQTEAEWEALTHRILGKPFAPVGLCGCATCGGFFASKPTAAFRGACSEACWRQVLTDSAGDDAVEEGPCPDCEGKGWLWIRPSAGYGDLEIQACDCGIFKSDDDARRAYRASLKEGA